jgi:hypothetical protein
MRRSSGRLARLLRGSLVNRRGAVHAALALGMVGCASGYPDLRAQDLGLGPMAAAPTEPSALARLQRPDSLPDPTAVRQTTFDSSPATARLARTMRVRALVNDVPILDDDVIETCFAPYNSARTDAERGEVFNHALQALIDQEVVLQDLNAKLEHAKPQAMQELKAAARKEVNKQIEGNKERLRKAGFPIHSDEDLKKALQSQGLSLDSLRRQLERQFMVREYMGSRIYNTVLNIGHTEILDYYEQHPNEFRVNDSVRWQDIFLDASRFRGRGDAQAFAEQLAARARRGEDFVALGTQYDNGDSSLYRHGEGLGQRHGEIKPPDVEPWLFQLKDGQVAVVPLANGFHVVRVVHRIYAGMRPLDAEAQNEIRKKIQNEVFEREYKSFVAELRRKASIEIHAQASAGTPH